jgi:hypothetical protein
MEMAARVRNFSHAHPSTDASFASVLGRLEETLGRMEELGGQQVDGVLSKHSSTVRRKAIRRRIQHGLLRHLVTVAQDAAAEKPALTDKFGLPVANASNKAFSTVTRKLLEYGVAEKELLVKHGLSDKLLDDLRAAADDFDASLEETTGGLHDHVLARAELDGLSDEIMLLVGMMDGINRYRFEREPELLVAWDMAKHVVAGPQTGECREPCASCHGAGAGWAGEVQPTA